MSFNIDDPLAGILSDGSDDSFFDDDVLGKKKPAKKTTPVSNKKNALFDLGDSEKPKANILDDKKDSLFGLGLGDSKKTSIDDGKTKVESSKSPVSIKRTLSKESIKTTSEVKSKSALEKSHNVDKSPAKAKISASADKLDVLEELIEPRKEFTKPIEKGKSSQSLLDDILGGSSTRTGGSSQAARPATAVKSQDFDFDTFLNKNESKPTVTADKNATKRTIVKAEQSKEDLGSKKKSNEDWLGIFEEKEADHEEADDGMPAWLVGSSKKKKAVDKEQKSTKPLPEKEPLREPEEINSNENLENKKQAEVSSNFEQLANVVLNSNATQSNNNEDIAAEGAALYLQQQESQLMVALQLKAQEEKLAALQLRQKETQRVQREAAQAQHAQLDAMLRRQAEQRQQMQAIISTHQQRITQRIKALLGTTDTDNDDILEDNKEDELGYSRAEKKESPHVKEKNQLLQLVQSLQENHDKEIDIMETSYRRQLAFLEVSLTQSEERMKEETDKLVKFYTEKISWLDEHHELYKKMTEDNLNSITERHKAENEMLRQQHLENVKVLQEHHSTLMEYIKNAVKQEQVLIQDSVSFSTDLHELVRDVKENKVQCQSLVEEVHTLVGNTQRDTERSLQTRELQINDMIQQLKKERDNFETEKAESRELVKMMETRLKQMTTMIEEETAVLKQKKMEFEFEKATFSKQTEFAKNVIKKQDEEIKMLKEDIQKEYREKIAKIDEEKGKALKDSAAIAKEKVSIQSLKQELEKTKVELQAQLEEITEERTKLNMEKQQLHMEEQRILAKSRDLDLLAKTAIEKQTQADKKYSEAEFIQKKYEERIRRMQEHVVSLNAREKQIAREKVALSRERLTLHNERKQIESGQHCSLCKPTQNMSQYNVEHPYAIPENFLNVPVSRDYGGSNINSAMNAIEHEMSHLMSRSFSLKHTTGVGNIGSHDERLMDDRILEDNVITQVTQAESGAFKDYMDPKFMMLRLDVQQVLSNLDQTKKDDDVRLGEELEE